MVKLNYEAAYLTLYRSGELSRRAEELTRKLSSCDLCPHNCRVNRLEGQKGFCRSGALPVVSSYCAHHGEEPALSGTRGSGTIFFGNCTMRCAYCQNFQISQDYNAQKLNVVDCRTLAARMLHLQNELGCHNLNLVSPTHFVPQIVQALSLAVPQGLHLPLVFNCGGYESVETIKALEGIVDIYLPDLRYSSDEHSHKYSQAPGYLAHSRAAIKEMYRQVGDLKVDENEIAYRGLIVRHLILPEGIAGSRRSLNWLARQISPSVTVSIMSQYYPRHHAVDIPELARTISYEEYSEVAEIAAKLGLENGWFQEMDAPANYLPDFDKDGHPFE
jgi:putative pyruvate formate lyase activating enzyme